MVGILFIILKIIGIVLLAIVGLVLFLLLLVLFVPVRYRIVIDKYENKDPSFLISAKLTYLLHLLNVHINYPGKELVRIRIVIFKVYSYCLNGKKADIEEEVNKTDECITEAETVTVDEGEKKDESLSEAKTVTVDEADDTDECLSKAKTVTADEMDKTGECAKEGETITTDECMPDAKIGPDLESGNDIESIASSANNTTQATDIKDYTETIDKKGSEGDEDTTDDKSSTAEDTEPDFAEEEPFMEFSEADKKNKKSYLDRLSEFASNYVNRIKLTSKRLCDNIVSIRSNTEYYIELVNSREFKEAFGLCKNKLIKIMKLLKPKHIKGYLNIGTGEPDTTAQIFGFYVLFRGFFGKKFSFVPYIDEKKFEGHIDIKGYICLFSLIIIGIRLFFDKNIRRVLKMIKKES